MSTSHYLFLFCSLYLLHVVDSYAVEPTDPAVYDLRRKLEWCGPRPKQHETFYPGLDDLNCIKLFPKLFDRSHRCLSAYDEHRLVGFETPSGNISNVQVDEVELRQVLRPELNIKAAVALVRRPSVDRLEDDGSSSLRIRYLGSSSRETFQPWSSTKLFAAFDAAARLRTLSEKKIGLAATESGNDNHLGDLATIITSYDVTRNLTSNGLGAYFHSIGKHKIGLQAAQQWLGATSHNISFGGNYGEPVPPQLGYHFMSQRDNASVEVEPDPTPSPPLDNSLNALALAEWLRRIVHLREAQPSIQTDSFPENETLPAWEDAQELLYGSNQSVFDGLQWGGASMSTDVYVQQSIANSIGMRNMSEQAEDQWRIFSKLGAGHSDTRGVNEIVVNAYACLPVLTNGKPIPNRGLEFAISLYVPQSTQRQKSDEDPWHTLDLMVTEAMTNITELLLSKYY